MTNKEELELILKLIGKYNLPLSPILEYAVKEKMEEFPEDNWVNSYDNDEKAEEEYIADEAFNTNFLPKSYDIKWFCLSVLTTLDGLMDNRTYQILHDTLNGESKDTVALKFNLTRERIRQIVVKATRQAKELLIEQHNNLAKEKEENARLNVQLNLMRDDIARLEAQLPKELLPSNKYDYEDLDAELIELLETPIKEIKLYVRATNILHIMGVNKFVDIPIIENENKVLEMRNSGRKTVRNISQMLKDFKLSFGMSVSAIVDVLKSNDWHVAQRKWMSKNQNDVKQNDSKIGIVAHEVEPLWNKIEQKQSIIDSTKSFGEDVIRVKALIDNRHGQTWTAEEEEIITQYFKQGVETTIIAEKVGRTEVAIKARLAKLGLIDYSYGIEDKSLVDNNNKTKVDKDDDEFRIENTSRKCSILNKYGKTVFSDDGKIKEINGKYYRLLLKFTSFTMKQLHFNGVTWVKGEAIITAYTESELYGVIYNSTDYYNEIEDIIDSPMIEKCQLKVNGIWYNYNGDLIDNKPAKSVKVINSKQTETPLIGRYVRLFPSHTVGKITQLKNTKWGRKLVVETINGVIKEIYDDSYMYEILAPSKVRKILKM